MYTDSCLIVPEFQAHDAQGSRIGICVNTYMWHIAYVCVIGMYMCVHLHTYMEFMYVTIYIHDTYIRICNTRIHTCIHTYMHACVHMYIHVPTSYIHTYIHTWIHT